MDKPTMPGVHSRIIRAFTGTPAYIAMYDDGAIGPERSTRDRAEVDYRDANAHTGTVRDEIERYGLQSAIFRPWDEIHEDFKGHYNGKRVCMALDSKQGCTTLSRWRGPLA